MFSLIVDVYSTRKQKKQFAMRRLREHVHWDRLFNAERCAANALRLRSTETEIRILKIYVRYYKRHLLEQIGFNCIWVARDKYQPINRISRSQATCSNAQSLPLDSLALADSLNNLGIYNSINDYASLPSSKATRMHTEARARRVHDPKNICVQRQLLNNGRQHVFRLANMKRDVLNVWMELLSFLIQDDAACQTVQRSISLGVVNGFLAHLDSNHSANILLQNGL
jgi:hypothetical protein